MRLLAIDTASHICSVALLTDQQLLLDEIDLPQGHSDQLLEMADALLKRANLTPADLTGVAFGRGPGSFTGLRIAAGVAQGIAYGSGTTVAPISNLAALALRAIHEYGARQILPAFDARMGEVYWGGYRQGDDNEVQPHLKEAVCAPQLVEVPQGDGWIGVGEGWQAYPEQLSTRCGKALQAIHPALTGSAREIALLGAAIIAKGQGLPPQQATPVYLRNQVARKPTTTPLGKIS
jgi:tRNA threonylcarbamoyladenosine biosynthesis protein TsaB